jgi:hypothetical protein
MESRPESRREALGGLLGMDLPHAQFEKVRLLTS